MFDFSEINLANELTALLFAIIQALLIALITKNALDRALQKERQIGKSLKDYGVEKVKSGDGKMSPQHVNIAFGLRGHRIPSEIDLCFISGRSFFGDFKDYIIRAVANGCKVRILLANPYSGIIYEKWKSAIDDGDMTKLKSDAYVEDVANLYYKLLVEHDTSTLRNASFIERSDAMLFYSKIDILGNEKSSCIENLKGELSKYGDHRYQVLVIKVMLAELKEKLEREGIRLRDDAVELRYYSDEYRLPITLVKKAAEKRKHAVTLLWTNMNAATREATESINIFCKVKESDVSLFVSDIENSFNYLWNCYPPASDYSAELQIENQSAANGTVCAEKFRV